VSPKRQEDDLQALVLRDSLQDFDARREEDPKTIDTRGTSPRGGLLQQGAWPKFLGQS
jgi:hypothetical protein